MRRTRSQTAAAAGCLLCTLIGPLPVRAAPPGVAPSVSPMSAPPVSVAPSPFDFAPTPLPLRGSASAHERQVAALLQGLEAVQRAEALFSGQAGQDLALQVVITCRPGRRLDVTALQSVVRLVCAAVPGLTPERLNVTDSEGTLLIAAGQVEAATADGVRASALQHGNGQFALLLVLATVVIGWGLWRSRKAAPLAEAPMEALIGRRPREFARLLAEERPEVAGAMVAALEPRLAKRLQRALRAERVAVKLPARAPDPAAVAVIAAMLIERT